MASKEKWKTTSQERERRLIRLKELAGVWNRGRTPLLMKGSERNELSAVLGLPRRGSVIGPNLEKKKKSYGTRKDKCDRGREGRRVAGDIMLRWGGKRSE